MKWSDISEIRIFLIGCIWIVPLSLVLAQSPLSKTQSESMPVIMSTDCGTEIDDQWTVTYLVISPELKVLGFLGNHARNGLTGEQARDTILDVLENRLDMTYHPPVLAGADGPIESREKPADNEAVRFLIDQSKAFTPLCWQKPRSYHPEKRTRR